MPLQGWDAVRILSQIASFQAIHYLLVATLLPPFLAIFAETESLMFEGGPTQVGMIFDWRQMAGQPTYDWSMLKGVGDSAWMQVDDEEGEVGVDPAILVRWNLDNVWLDSPMDPGGSMQDRVLDHERILRFKVLKNGTSTPETDASIPATTVEEALEHWEWSHTRDSARSSTLIFTWLLTIPLDILLLVYLVRRPTHMLDHALTLHTLHLVATTCYSHSLPKGLRWWLTMLVHAAVMVVWSEQLAIKRELGRTVGYSLVGGGTEDEALAKVVFDADQVATGERIELRSL